MTSHSYETPVDRGSLRKWEASGIWFPAEHSPYGEEFEVISDPFPEAGGIAVSVKTKKGDGVRVIQLPATVLQSVEGALPNVA